MTDRSSGTPSGAPCPGASALFVGPLNSQAVMGLPWRRVRDHARELGIPLVPFGKALLVPASALLEALRARQAATPPVGDPEASNDTLDPAESIRRRLGVQRIA